MAGRRATAIKRHGGQMARFGGVGILCAVTDFALFALFVAFGATPAPANIAAFLVANVEGYFLNGRLTFRGAGLSFKGYAKYFGAYAASLVLSTIIVGALAGSLGPLAAKLIATAVAAICNYVISALVVFRRAGGDAAPQSR